MDKTIWTEHISARQARSVARALRIAGYKTATISKCRGYVINIAEYFEPADMAEQQHVLGIICEAAGIQPRKIKEEGR